jgi:hypothetical protein
MERRTQTSLLLFCLLILCCGQAISESQSRRQRERWLKKASIVSVKDVGQGATKPQKVTLDDGVRRGKAIFKTIDLRMKTDTRFGSQTVDEFIDSYKYEIAAYELDKLLGLDMLPVTVERRIDGKRGSLREWVDQVIPHYGHDEPLPDMDRVEREMHTVWLFDYLIYNLDRRVHNLMLAPGWSPVLIDHSMTFTTFTEPFRPMRRFPAEVVDKLRELDRRKVRKALGRYLRRNQIDAFMARRQIVLDTVSQRLSNDPEGNVLFSLCHQE